MKNKLKKSLKATILFIFILSLMTSCEQNSLIEANQNSLISNQQSRFKVTVLNNEKIKSNNKIVQKLSSIDLKNKKNSNTTFSKEIYNKLGFTINTDNVNYMEDTQTGIHSYSFQINRDSIKTPNLENLLIQSNNKGGYDAYIIQYGFTSEEYANLNANSIKNYKTQIYSIDFDTSTFKNGMFSKMVYGCTETWEWAMVDDGDRGELVGAGNEDPFEAGWVLTGISCGYSDDGTGNSGGQTTNPTNTSGGGASAVIAAPNTVPYTSQLKNFESGTLNSVERTYYHSDPQSNIKSTIDWHLIQNNFSEASKSDAKSALAFSSTYKLNFQQFNWVLNNRGSEELLDIKSYVVEMTETTTEIEEFVQQMITYSITHSNTTTAQYENWFMGTSEGQDGTYDAVYWENPNLTFQHQDLPTLSNFKNACPSKYSNAGTVCNDIGGDVLTMYNAVVAQNKKLNTCAIRMSKALNYSGVVVPSLPDNPDGTKNSVTGADGKNYIINAKALNTWMKKTFGTNPSNYLHYTAAQGGTNGTGFPKLLEGKQGIYSMVSRTAIHKTWGTGHADLLENGECLLKCHFYDTDNNFVPVDYIDVWILN